MAREKFDGRLVTRCDGCGDEIGDQGFAGVPGLTEYLGIGICPRCREAGTVRIPTVLLESGLLSQKGRRAVEDFMYLRSDPEIRDLVAMVRGDDDAAARLLEGRDN